MEDENLRKLVNLMFRRDFPNLSETTTYSSLPSIMLTKRFSQSMGTVLRTKKMVMYCRYGTFVDNFCYKMFTSHEMYLRYVIFALVTEHNCYKDIFEGFLSVCAVLVILSNNTLLKTGMNFCDLNSDIFMVFYHGMMHKLFKKAGGLQQFGEHILNHTHVKQMDSGTVKDVDDFINEGSTNLDDLLKGECYELTTKPEEIENDTTSFLLAKKVLLKKTVELPTLLTKRELVEKLVEYRRTKMEKEAEGKLKQETVSKSDHSKKVLEKPVVSKKDSGSNQAGNSKEYQLDNKDIVKLIMKYKADKKISDEAEQKENGKQNEGIVQPDMRSNSNTYSKSNYVAKQKKGNAEKGSIVETATMSKSNSDSKTNYEAEQKEDKVEIHNVEAAIKSNLDSKRRSKGGQKKDNVNKKDIVKAAVVSKSNLEPEDQKENNANNDVTIQKIMLYNRSKNAGLVESDDILVKKADEVLQHMKRSIQSLIKVLDEYDEE